jgi:microcystin-dependent protein
MQVSPLAIKQGLSLPAGMDPQTQRLQVLEAAVAALQDQSFTRYAITGEVKIWMTGTAPAGWVFLTGSAVSRISYGRLFSVLGTSWGAGDGVNTFNLPDMRGRVPIGAGTGSGLTARTLGQLVGSETLTIAQLPSHSHGGATGTMNSNWSHGHTLGGTSQDSGTFMTSDWQGVAGHAGWGGHVGRIDGGAYLEYLTANATDINHTHNIAAEGGGQGHVQPSTVVNFIMKD